MRILDYLKSHPRVILWTTLVLFAIPHILTLWLPPNGYHKWRESDTAAIIENYYQEDMNPLHPRVNQRGDKSGITGMELPLYNYTAALLYHVLEPDPETGPYFQIPRGLTLLAGLISLWLVFSIARFWLDELGAAIAAWATACSPLFFYYSSKIMPDIWMLTLGLGSVLCYLHYLDNRKVVNLLGAGLLLVLSAAIKPLILCILLPFLVMSVRKSDHKLQGAVKALLFATVTIVPVVLWFLWARQVNIEHESPGFYLGENMGSFAEMLFSAQFFKKLFLQWPWELWIGWALVPVFLTGLVLSIRRRSLRASWWWVLAVYIVFIPMAQHARSHDYYSLIIVPPLALLTALGASYLWEHRRWYSRLALVLLLLAPMGTFARIHQRFGSGKDFYEVRSEVNKVIPRDALVICHDDNSAILLYQLNRHGWVVRDVDTHHEVDSLIKLGGQYFLSDEDIVEVTHGGDIRILEPLEAYSDSLQLLFHRPGVRLAWLHCYQAKEKP